MKALISIDYTNDFVATDGRLTTGIFGQAIEERISQLTQKFTDDNDFVVYAIDCHEVNDPYHPENLLFPAHNVIGSEGRNLYGKVASVYEESKDKECVYWLDKRHYSAFSGTNLDIRLREHKITELHLVGVCTDICILHTAIDAYNLGYDLYVHKDAVASFDPIGHKWALNHFEKVLGAKII